MKYSRGFTLIEILFVVIVMTVLMTLGVVGVRSTLVSARDSERRSDTEIIARGLEQNYALDSFGIYKITGKVKGAYPGNNHFWHALGEDFCHIPGEYTPCNSKLTNGYLDYFLPGVTVAARTSPSGKGIIPTWYYSPDNATRLNQITSNVMNFDFYIYEPLNRDGSMCNGGGCRQFKLYYKDEATNTLKFVRSKNR
jgi:prepilin-type N-terminal cleavage/methylation domain-containing protein